MPRRKRTIKGKTDQEKQRKVKIENPSNESEQLCHTEVGASGMEVMEEPVQGEKLEVEQNSVITAESLVESRKGGQDDEISEKSPDAEWHEETGASYARADGGTYVRHLRRLSVEKPGKFMENWNPETSNRETRKMHRKIYSERSRAFHLHDEQGVHIRSGKDMCDCLYEDCTGCHNHCPKCDSPKCGHECRNNRRWVYDSIEVEGTDYIIKSVLKY